MGRMRKRDLMGQTSDFTWFQQVSTGFDRLKKQVSAKLGGFNQAEQWPCHKRHDGRPNHRDQRRWKVVQSDVTTVSNTSHPRISRIYAYDCIWLHMIAYNYGMYSDELRTWNRGYLSRRGASDGLRLDESLSWRGGVVLLTAFFSACFTTNIYIYH